MSKDFEYDPETGSFRFDESGEKTKKKTMSTSAAGFDRGAVCLRPVAHRPHRAHLQALGQAEKVSSPRGGMRTSTSPNANVSSRSKVESPW